MDSVTKHRQTQDALCQLSERAFPGLRMTSAAELTDGFFNVAYAIGLSDGRTVILKIAPPPDIPVMSYEKDLLAAEVAGLRLARQRTDMPVPEVLMVDRSHAVCPSDYFFMTKVEGDNLRNVIKNIEPAQLAEIDFELGVWNAQLHAIGNQRFGYFSQPAHGGENWFDVFGGMLRRVFDDGAAHGTDMGVPHADITALLAGERSLFEQVRRPCMVHWDLWDGNIFVKDGHVSGIIDFERCLWGDPLMEWGFRSCNERPADFLRGYGAPALTPPQRRRVLWYDLYLYLIMVVECGYRQYPTNDQYEWAKREAQKTLRLLA